MAPTLTSTPGPWTVETDQATHGDLVITKECFEVCRIEHCADPHTARQNRANARLIAAAPTMLSALTAARRKLEMWPEGMNPEYFPEIKAIDFAIAKAEGRIDL